MGQRLTASRCIPNEMKGSTNAFTEGVKVSKKKLGETDTKATSICLKEVPKKVTDENASRNKKIPKKRGSQSSTGAHQALDSTKKSEEKKKNAGLRPKNGQKSQIGCGSSTFIFQHTETAGSTDIMRNIITAGYTLDENFNAHSPAFVTGLSANEHEVEYQTKIAKPDPKVVSISRDETRKADVIDNTNLGVIPDGEIKAKNSNKRNSSALDHDFRMSEPNDNENGFEYQTKRAKSEQKVNSIIQDEGRKADVIDNTKLGDIPDGEIKPKNATKRISSALDPIAIDEKVRNCHSTDKLKSLTVPELKCFLTAKKAKVGGKKEELIQRIVVFLSS